MNAPQPYGAQQYGFQQTSTPYHAPPPSYAPYQQIGNYGEYPSQQLANFQGPPQQQWNHMYAPQPVRDAPPYQYQHGSYTDAVYPPSTPSFHTQSPHSSQGRDRAQSFHKKFQSPIPPHNRSQQANPSIIQTTPVSSIAQSNRSDTTFDRDEPGKTTSANGIKAETPNKNGTGRLSDDDDDRLTEDQQFAWDMTCIFMDVSPKETVRLACPLSISFAVTPVPLLDADSKLPVSRFLRDVNINSFSKSVREAANWPVLKIDPAFAEIDLDSPLIPIDEIRGWMAKRQGIIDSPEASRKRTRSKEPDFQDRQGDIDDQMAHGTDFDTQGQSPPSKRRRSENSNQVIREKEAASSITTLVYEARAGTPCLVSDDNAWAPEPGERACSPAAPGDNTEALLVSLGVTGSPKPVLQESLPHYQPTLEVLEVSTDHQSSSSAPKNRDKGADASSPESKLRTKTPQNSQYRNHALQIGTPQYGPLQQVPSHYGLPHNVQSSFSQHQTPLSHQGQRQQPQLQPQANHQYENAPPNNAPYENSRHGNDPRLPFNNGNHGPPQPEYSGPAQYGNGVNGHAQHRYPAPNAYGNTLSGQGMNGPPQQMIHNQPSYGSNVINHSANDSPQQLNAGQFHNGTAINRFPQQAYPVQSENGNSSNGHNPNSNIHYGPPTQHYLIGAQLGGPHPQNFQHAPGPGPQTHDNISQSSYNQGPRYHDNQSGYCGNENHGTVSNTSKVCVPFCYSLYRFGALRRAPSHFPCQ